MKKLYVFCLFIIFSLGMFAQQLNTDGEPHFDKLIGVKFIKPYYPNGVNYDFLLNYTITKKGNDYYLTGKWENPGTTEIENVKTKLKVYKKIFLKSEDGDIFAYDIKKNCNMNQLKDMDIFILIQKLGNVVMLVISKEFLEKQVY